MLQSPIQLSAMLSTPRRRGRCVFAGAARRLLETSNRIGHTGTMMTVDQQTWTTLAALATFALGLFAYLATMKRELRADFQGDIVGLDAKLDSTRVELKANIAGLDTSLDATRRELKDDIADMRSELKAELGKVENRLISLENRTYDISTRLPAAPAGSSTP